MVKVKICGLRCREDIDAINQLGVDYAGFVFAPSKREVSCEQAKRLAMHIEHAKKVGVFVNKNVCDMLWIAKECALDVIQLHGDEAEATIRYLKANSNCEIWKAMRISSQKDLLSIKYYHPDRFLFDAFHETMYGGSGTAIQQHLLQDLDLKQNILAGGINVDNVREKLTLSPYGIDVSSGVEGDGKKDINKLRNLMKEVKGQ